MPRQTKAQLLAQWNVEMADMNARFNEACAEIRRLKIEKSNIANQLFSVAMAGAAAVRTMPQEFFIYGLHKEHEMFQRAAFLIENQTLTKE